MTDPNQVDAVLDAVARGDSAAFMQVVQAHGLMLRSYIGAQVFNTGDVDDLAQETFIAAYRTLHSFRRGDDMGAWLRGIARNKVLMYFRSTQRRTGALDRFRAEVVEIMGDDLEVASAGDRHEHIAALLRCIARLPEKLRRVVHAGLDGTKVSALAEALQTSAGAVYQLHYRANQLLRECVLKEVQDV
ncbi:sigma-70 family RNA polymerase sigma factor [Prosthecobacter sp.]|uniref:sigma-70 family RNA polymerase sigma factor n=1 Tax=Prosthecobacter sp. TaxID=1965333 RepID=UPI00378362BF